MFSDDKGGLSSHVLAPPSGQRLAIGTMVSEVAALSDMDQYARYCREHRISSVQELDIISQLIHCYVEPDFLEALVDHGEKVKTMVEKMSSLSLSRGVHSYDVAGLSSVGGEKRPSFKSEMFKKEGPITTFCLTDYGWSLTYDKWQVFCANLKAQGFLGCSTTEALENVFGVRSCFKKSHSELVEPVPLNMTKSSLAFLISLMYGTMKYVLKEECSICGHSMPAGEYGYQPLIRTANGHGVNKKGVTKDPYWIVIDGAVVYRNKRPSMSERHRGHGYTTSRSSQVNTLQASKILYCLDMLTASGR